MEDNISWDQLFMTQAYLMSMKSKDRSTKVGAVIVGPANDQRSSGFNSPVRGFNDLREDIHEKPKKYSFMEHAERNAIYNAARVGIPLEGCRMYVPWCPCTDCARAIVQSGITEVITHLENPKNHHETSWAQSLAWAQEMLRECGVNLRVWSGELLIPNIYVRGEIVENPLDNK